MKKVVMALIKGADQILMRRIPGFDGFDRIVRSGEEAVKHINEFLEYEGKFLFIYQIQGEKIVNMYDISQKHKIRVDDIGEVGIFIE